MSCHKKQLQTSYHEASYNAICQSHTDPPQPALGQSSAHLERLLISRNNTRRTTKQSHPLQPTTKDRVLIPNSRSRGDWTAQFCPIFETTACKPVNPNPTNRGHAAPPAGMPPGPRALTLLEVAGQPVMLPVRLASGDLRPSIHQAGSTPRARPTSAGAGGAPTQRA